MKYWIFFMMLSNGNMAGPETFATAEECSHMKNSAIEAYQKMFDMPELPARAMVGCIEFPPPKTETHVPLPEVKPES